MSEKPSATPPGTVEKIIKSPIPDEPEKAQIAVEGADHLYREIRIDNTLTNENGEEVSLRPGAQVEVTVQADRLVSGLRRTVLDKRLGCGSSILTAFANGPVPHEKQCLAGCF